jgi:hypothetical protein
MATYRQQGYHSTADTEDRTHLEEHLIVSLIIC